MNYLYLGVSDLYLPAITAAVHLGQLDSRTPPAKDVLLRLPYYHAAGKEDDGKLTHAGEDSQGNQVYVTCVKGHPDVIIRAVGSLLGIYQISLKEVKVIACVPENPQVALICSLLTKAGLKSVADWLGFKLIRNRYADMVKLSAKPTSA
jgi:hypothetical protein